MVDAAPVVVAKLPVGGEFYLLKEFLLNSAL